MAPKISPAIVRGIAALQHLVQLDEGGRGIGALVRSGQLLAAAQTLVNPKAAGGVVVLTGFPCLRERQQPMESDGPPGAVAVARTLVTIGRAPVVLAIEDYAQSALQLCVEASGPAATAPEVAGFPTANRWTPADDERLEVLRASASSLVCLERAGEASDGVCRTMRGLPMGPTLLGHMNRLLGSPGMQSVGIGDGGNELGMGSLYEDICAAIPKGAEIGCPRASDAVPLHRTP